MRARYLSLVLSFLFILNTPLQAQRLSDYRWENRLILLLTDHVDDPLLKQQLRELKADERALTERKLLIFQISPQEVKRLFPREAILSQSSHLYQQFKQGKSPFELLLIGLDGGKKLEKAEFVSRSYIFSLIDGMPMRRAEIRSKSKKN